MVAFGVIVIVAGVIAVVFGILQNTVFLNIADVNAGLGRMFGDIDLNEHGDIIAQSDSGGLDMASALGGPGTFWIILGAIAIAIGIFSIIVGRKRRKGRHVLPKED